MYEHHHHHESTKWIWTAFFLNLSFAIIEWIGGFWTNSIAIISDAIHDLGDSLAIGLAYIFEKISKRKANEKYTYWYARFLILGALITVFILIIGSFFILKNAITRFSNPSEINSVWMLILAVIGLLINWFAARKTAKWEWLNEKAITLHLLEDVLGRAAVLVWSILIYFFHRNFIDPLLSVWICVFILINACKLLKWVIDIFLEKTPEWISHDEVLNEIKKLDGVLDIHHIHLWTLDGNKNYITIHALIDKKIICTKNNCFEKDYKRCFKKAKHLPLCDWIWVGRWKVRGRRFLWIKFQKKPIKW